MLRSFLLLIVAVALPSFLGGCVSAPPLAVGTAPPTAFDNQASTELYVLGPGDLMTVTVFGHFDIVHPDTVLRIDPQGNLVLPVAGAVPVGGHTLADATVLVEQAFMRYIKQPEVGMSIYQPRARFMYVLGEVRAPGPIPMELPLNALQALAHAGGVGPYGDREHVVLLRLVDQTLQVHEFNAATPGPEGYVVVQPDDLIFVRQSNGGAWREELVPVLQSVTPVIGALTNFLLVSEALDD
ncbi:MAG: polysaccharide biosynthesis/export family protein [Planctomycetota bacterium]|jgi:protein involved in polysaccharide export with SLBB domain